MEILPRFQPTMSNKTKILIVDDESPIRKLIHSSLDEELWEVLESETGREGLQTIATRNPSVVILDLGLPDIDGVKLIEELREWSQVPVLVLSARGEEEMKVRALDAGANDYVTKPFSVTELHARIRAILRTHRPGTESRASVFEAKGVRIDLKAREVWKGEARVHLTPLEYQLLTLLAQNAGCVLTHRQILSQVWGEAYTRQHHYVRVLMKSLRHKLEDDPARPKLLVTESGVGYRLRM